MHEAVVLWMLLLGWAGVLLSQRCVMTKQPATAGMKAALPSPLR